MKKITVLLTALAVAGSLFAGEHPVKAQIAKYEAQAGEPLDAARGKELWEKKVPGEKFDKSCTNCHNADVTQPGKNKAKNDKKIKPMALSANPNAYKRSLKVEHNFNTYCEKVYGQKCTAREKGDILLYLSQQ